MLLNNIWIAFFLISFVVALVRTLGYFLHAHWGWFEGLSFSLADRNVFFELVQSTFAMSKTSVEISIYLIGVMTLWLGIMKIGEKGGAVSALSKATSPLFTRIFPEIPKNHPAMGAMLMNICANMLGLDNAATPLGLKAMKELQSINPEKEKASNAQILFLVLNTSGLTIIPISIMAVRLGAGAANPSDVFLPLLLSTYFATLGGLIIVSIFQKINLFQPVILLYLGGFTAFILGLIAILKSMSQSQVEAFATVSGNFLLFSIIIIFFLLANRRKINLYETFIEGAKEGFGVAIKIIPYLVAMLVAIGVFRASGAMDFVVNAIGGFFKMLGLNTDFVPALPTAIMRPLSGSGARGLMIETMTNYGPDSFPGRLSCILQGTTETTFYTVAVYYGAIGIKKTRYTIGCGLFADLVGAVAAIFMAYLFFGS